MLKLIAILLPAIIDLINRKINDSDLRFWISVGVCSVFGVLISFAGNNFVFAGIDAVSESILAVFGLAQLSYKVLWENSDIREKLQLDATRISGLRDA